MTGWEAVVRAIVADLRAELQAQRDYRQNTHTGLWAGKVPSLAWPPWRDQTVMALASAILGRKP